MKRVLIYKLTKLTKSSCRHFVRFEKVSVCLLNTRVFVRPSGVIKSHTDSQLYLIKYIQMYYINISEYAIIQHVLQSSSG